jgi:hypothetical protein
MGFLVIHLRYYVLRDDMLAYYLSDLIERLPNMNEAGGLEVSTSTSVHASGPILR